MSKPKEIFIKWSDLPEDVRKNVKRCIEIKDVGYDLIDQVNLLRKEGDYVQAKVFSECRKINDDIEQYYFNKSTVTENGITFLFDEDPDDD